MSLSLRLLPSDVDGSQIAAFSPWAIVLCIEHAKYSSLLCSNKGIKGYFLSLRTD